MKSTKTKTKAKTRSTPAKSIPGNVGRMARKWRDLPVAHVDLTPLKFSPPEGPNNTSVADYVNPKTGQRFQIIVNGYTAKAVVRYTKTLKGYFEVIPYDLKPSESTRNSDARESDTKDVRDDNTNTIETQFKVIDTQGISGPYIVRFILDPTSHPINEFGSENHKYSYRGVSIDVTAIANTGEEQAKLNNGAWRNFDALDDTPPPPSLQFTLTPNICRLFTLRVRGRSSGYDSYTLSGSWVTVPGCGES